MDHFLRLFNDLPANFQTRIYTSYPSCCRFLAQISPIKISFNFSIPFQISPPRFPHPLNRISFNLHFLFSTHRPRFWKRFHRRHHQPPSPTSFHTPPLPGPVVSVSVGKSVVASSKASEHRRRPLDNLYLRTTIPTSLEPPSRRLQDRQMHTTDSGTPSFCRIYLRSITLSETGHPFVRIEEPPLFLPLVLSLRFLLWIVRD